MYYSIHKDVSFNHSYDARQIVKYVFRILSCDSEFGKRSPYNIGLKLCNFLNTGINNFQNFSLHKKYVNYKLRMTHI